MHGDHQFQRDLGTVGGGDVVDEGNACVGSAAEEEDNAAAVVVAESSGNATPTQTNSSGSSSFPSSYHKDAYLLFRALCKLSMKGLSEESSNSQANDPIALQNK
jgi:hypothetical protein